MRRANRDIVSRFMSGLKGLSLYEVGLVIHGRLDELDNGSSNGALSLKPLDHVNGEPEANLPGVF